MNIKSLFILSLSTLLILTVLFTGCVQTPKQVEPSKPILPEPSQNVSLQDAERILGIKVPTPSYLPSGYALKEVHIEGEHRIRLSFYKGSDSDQYKMELMIYATQVPALKLVGEAVMISENHGVILDEDAYNSLYWQITTSGEMF